LFDTIDLWVVGSRTHLIISISSISCLS
jgi:hypothetical protein